MQNINRITTEFELWILTLSSRSSTLTCHLYFLPQDGSTHKGLNTEAAVNQKTNDVGCGFKVKWNTYRTHLKTFKCFYKG